ncbi:hypothetical protein COV17_00705 [Candidatus Woesearchaeota archaeon CG10_big_fil_rev_8_21_14_0_10_36_11]|nr:MAG: hypothetical protein COV17_00705 [Candidatus Woesearchaeota archaeon CG10_big_fil_rev_8_21_14_0_10_36_11]
MKEVETVYTRIRRMPIDHQSTFNGVGIAVLGMYLMSFTTFPPLVIVSAAMVVGYTLQEIQESRRLNVLFRNEYGKLIERHRPQLKNLFKDE